MSPRSYQNFFEFQNESNTIKSIVDSPCLEKIVNNKSSK